MAQTEYVQTQIQQMVRRALEHASAGTTDSTDEIYRLPVESYSPRSWDEEMNAIFRRLPLMLALSAEMSRGAVPYNVTPEHTARAAAILGPNRILAVEQKVTIETDPIKARELGRKELARYMVLPNYRNNWLRIGFSEGDLANGGSDRFIDAMCLWGDAETVKKGLRAHFAAGATHVCLQPVHADGDFAARDRMLAALADT